MFNLRVLLVNAALAFRREEVDMSVMDVEFVDDFSDAKTNVSSDDFADGFSDIFAEVFNEIQANSSSGQVLVKYHSSSRGSWIWDDRGSGACQDGTCYKVPRMTGYKPLGDLFKGGTRISPFIGNLPMFSGDVVHPMDFDWVWSDAGSGGTYDLNVWKPRAKYGYSCPADAVTQRGKPSTSDYVCLPTRCLVQHRETRKTWNDGCSGANRDFDAFTSPIHPGYFIGQGWRSGAANGLYKLAEHCGGVTVLNAKICPIERASTTQGTLVFDKESREGTSESKRTSTQTKIHFAAQVSARATSIVGTTKASVSAAAQSSYDSLVKSALHQTRTTFDRTHVQFTCSAPCFVYQVQISYTLSNGESFTQQSSLKTTAVKMPLC